MDQFIGWTGACLFLTAYFLLTIKKIQADKILYQLMNVAGGLCLIINAYSIKDHPTLYLNLLWTAIAVVGIFKVIRYASLNKRNVRERHL